MPAETTAVAMVVGTVVSAPIMVLFGFVLAAADPGSTILNSTSAAMTAA
jgi:hypothetical protein